MVILSQSAPVLIRFICNEANGFLQISCKGDTAVKKRFFIALLAICLVMSLGTASALADRADTSLPAASEEGVIDLVNDVVLSQSVDISENTVLNLNGYSITASSEWTGGDYVIGVKRGATLTINDTAGGSIEGGENPAIYAAVKLTLTGKDDPTKAAGLVVNGGRLQGYYYGVSGNGSRHNTNISVNGGEITGTHGTGIYHPQYGSLTVSNGDISGLNSAIELRAGTLKISGGTFTADATEYEESKNGSGTTVAGAAVVVSQHTTKMDISVTITGGTFTGARAFSQTDIQNEGAKENVEIEAISGGTFNGDVVSDECTGFITGGRFFEKNGVTANKDIPDEYFPEGSSVEIDDGGNVVPGESAVATVNGVGYPTLQAAINAAGQNGSVVIEKNIDIDLSGGSYSGQIFSITSANSGLTIDGRGKVITVTGEGASDVHVFNIQSASGVEIKNLTIVGSGGTRNGVNAYESTGVKLTNVNISGNGGRAVVVNSSDVVAEGLTVTGSVNIDNGSGTSGGAKFTLKSGNVDTIYTDNSSAAQAADIVIDNGTVSSVTILGRGDNSVVVNNGSIKNIFGLGAPDIRVNGGVFGKSVKEYAADNLNYEVKSGNTYRYFEDADDALAFAGANDAVTYIGESTATLRTVTFVCYTGSSYTLQVPDGTVIELPRETYGGYYHDGWKLGGVTYDVGTEIKVESDLTFTAVWKDGQYDISFSFNTLAPHGSAAAYVNAASVTSADFGDRVYLRVVPDTGYKLESVTVVTGNAAASGVAVTKVLSGTYTGYYTFTMPASDVVVKVSFARDGVPFVDVRPYQWHYSAVYYVYTNGLMEGDGLYFRPDDSMTRAMFWTVLARIDGENITGLNWAAQARAWAMREGVSDGTDPNGKVTREQMVTMLWRYLNGPDGTASLSGYADAGQVSSWAQEAMSWAVGRGIIEGMGASELNPRGTATRAQCATIFMRAGLK